MNTMKFAVTPGFQEGGIFFKPDQLAWLMAIVGDDAKIELTSFKQLYIEMQEQRFEKMKVKISELGLEIYSADSEHKSHNGGNHEKSSDSDFTHSNTVDGMRKI